MNERKNKELPSVLRTVIEVGFIVFLFYANIFMGEFINSGMGRSKGFVWAFLNIFTINTFIIAIIAGLIGQLVFSYLRKKF